VLLARLGARLPGGLEIAERELGGVVSRGMLCSERELDAGNDESGIVVLDPAVAARPGTSAADALGLRDTVYELSLTPNRGDCLGHVGLARELCALFDAPFALPRPSAPARLAAAGPALFPQSAAVFALGLGTAGAAAEDAGFRPVRVDIADGARCPRYGAGLAYGVTIGPSPFWLRHRLHVLGLRAINNVVDITNYVLLLWGHPIHSFDYDRVDTGTRRVLIECAYFDPRSVRRTSKRAGLHTDSSHRFERGVDPQDVRAVLASTLSLIAELTGATAVASGLDVVGQPLPARALRLRSARIATLLGAEVPAAGSRRSAAKRWPTHRAGR
jgi:phenylalanyl-tRNA synthetase beta chain